ncbi:uncharacterized protein TNCV_2282641 [Trichonephila clavipes]|nr:uncharacterized protein TNCV_2282641 [Trichonephila clavipes]
MLNLKRGKGFQKSAANPLLKTLLEGRKIRAVHFRSLSSRAEKSILFSWRVKDRTIKMCSNITTQHIEDLKLVLALSIVVDESCDINDTSQVSLFVRFMPHPCPKEELLGLLPIKGQKRGEDITKTVIECMDKHHIPLDKIVSISTDGFKSMTSVRKGFVVIL